MDPEELWMCRGCRDIFDAWDDRDGDIRPWCALCRRAGRAVDSEQQEERTMGYTLRQTIKVTTSVEIIGESPLDGARGARWEVKSTATNTPGTVAGMKEAIMDALTDTHNRTRGFVDVHADHLTEHGAHPGDLPPGNPLIWGTGRDPHSVDPR